MHISSNTNSLTPQYSTKTVKQTNSNENYLHKAIKLELKGEQNKIEFRDLQSGKLVEIYIHEEIQKQLKNKFDINLKEGETLKAKGKLEKYFQTMWNQYINIDKNVDVNDDGYLDKNELLESKRVHMVGYDENNKVTLVDYKTQNYREAFGKEEGLIKIKDDFLRNGITEEKMSVDFDFNCYLFQDKNLDTNFSNKEHLISMGLSEDEINSDELLAGSSFSLDNEMAKRIKALAEYLKKKGLDEIMNYSSRNNETKQEVQNISSKLFKSSSELPALNERDILIQTKVQLEVSLKYSDTQADNAKIFCLKG